MRMTRRPQTSLHQCICLTTMRCHFCEEELEHGDLVFEYDEETWCDWVLTRPVNHTTGDTVETTERYHIFAHTSCAEGQIGVERG